MLKKVYSCVILHSYQHQTRSFVTKNQRRFLHRNNSFSYSGRKITTEENSELKKTEQKHFERLYLKNYAKSYISSKLIDLEESLFHKYLKGYNRRRTKFTALSVTLCFFAIILVYFFREPIKDNISDEVADVASRSLGDEALVLKANEVSRIVLSDLINDEYTQSIVTGFVKDIVSQPVVMESLKSLIVSVTRDESVQFELFFLLQKVFEELIKDKKNISILIEFLQNIIQSKEAKDAVFILLNSLILEENTQVVISQFVSSVLKSEFVVNEASELSKSVATSILNDEKIQKKTGEALWNAGIHSVTPTWLEK